MKFWREPFRIQIVLSNCSYQRKNLNSQELTGEHQIDPEYEKNIRDLNDTSPSRQETKVMPESC